MKKLVISTLSAVILSSLACGRSVSTVTQTTPSGKPSERTLTGKSLDEVLQVKYDKALLVCKTWSKEGKAFDPSTEAPIDVQQFDLKTENVRGKAFSVSAQSGRMETKVDFEILDVKLTNVNLTVINDRTTYKITYTPVVEVRVKDRSIVRYDGGGYSELSSGGDAKSVYEQISSTMIDGSNGLLTSDIRYYNRVECTIEAEVKPAFKDQFSAEKY